MAILTSTMRMQLDAASFIKNADQLAAALDKDVKRIDALKTALKETGASDRLQASMVKLGASSTHVEGLKRAMEQFRKEQGLVGVAAGKMTDEQKKAMRTFESVTAATFRQVIADEKAYTAATRAQALERERIARREAEQEEEAHRRAMHRVQERASLRHYATSGVAAAVSAHGVVSGGERVIEAGADLQDTRLAMIRAGIDPVMRVRLEQQALDLSRRYANVGQIAIMDLQKEARSVLRDQKEVFGVTEILAKAKSVLDAGGGHSEGLGKLVKGAESIGAANDPARMAKLIDAYVKAIQVMGETINPDQIYEFDKYLKTAGATVSDRFLMTTGLSLSQEMGGSTAANDIFHAQKDIVGGFQNKHVPIKELVRMGLIDSNDVEYTKTGEAKGIKAGRQGVRGASLAQTDLDEWVYKYLLPALEQHGMKNENAQLAYIQKVFTGGEGDVIAKLIQQRESFENHGAMFGKASGTAGADFNADSATAGLSAFNAALTNLMSNVSVEAMSPIGHVLYQVADGMNVIAQAAKDYSKTALTIGGGVGAAALAGSGYLSWKVLGGMQVQAARTQIAAAEMQLAAAEKSAAGGAVNAVENAAPVGLASMTLGGLALAIGGVVAPTVAAVVAGRWDNKLKEDTAKTWNTPQAQALPDMDKQTWWEWMRGALPGHADGGIIAGSGGPRSDKIGIRVSAGEAVIPADAVQANRATVEALIAGRSLTQESIARWASPCEGKRVARVDPALLRLLATVQEGRP